MKTSWSLACAIIAGAILAAAMGLAAGEQDTGTPERENMALRRQVQDLQKVVHKLRAENKALREEKQAIDAQLKALQTEVLLLQKQVKAQQMQMNQLMQKYRQVVGKPPAPPATTKPTTQPTTRPATQPPHVNKHRHVSPHKVFPQAREQFVRWTRAAVAALLASLDTFSFRLERRGPNAEKHKSLYLSVQAAPKALPDSYVEARVSEQQAAAVIGYLAGDGMLYRGAINRRKLLAAPKGPYYWLSVSNGKGDEYYEFIPWTAKPFRWHGHERPPALQQFHSLRPVLTGDAGKAMDALVANVAVGGGKAAAEQ